MKRNSNYKTKQKETIINIIKELNKEFTIKDIYIDLNKEIGLTTIYRLVDKLVNEGVLLKTIGNDNITYYQYLEECEEENHFFLKCEKCGELEHVDCDCIESLSNHISKEHKFNLTDHIIIPGICKDCFKENKNEK